MRKFQALQAKPPSNDWDDDDDFAQDYAANSASPDEFGDDERLAGAEASDARLGQRYVDAETELPPPKKTKVHTARYVSSAVTLASCPKPQFPEFAVIGRSNVGKSSLINMLTNSKNLALVSKQPGKTKCINHFLINGEWWLVDLPGYGYAKSAKDDRVKWNDFTKDYFLRRETLVMVLLLVDGSIPPQQIDLECAIWMAESEVPFTVVFTKIDKRKKGLQAEENMQEFLRLLEQETSFEPDSFVTSAVEDIGRVPVLGYLSSLRQLFQAQTTRSTASPYSPAT